MLNHVKGGELMLQDYVVNAASGHPLLFAVIAHEVAHGWVAGKLGDPTARLMGRLTLNPLVHIDLIGTVILPLLLLSFNHRFFLDGEARFPSILPICAVADETWPL